MSLPKNLLLDDNIYEAIATSYRTNLQPSSGTTCQLGDITYINIGTGQGLYLNPSNSVLKFAANITGVTANSVVRLDSCGAHGYIQRLKVYLNGELQADVDNYNQFAKQCFDMQLTESGIYGSQNIMCGTRGDRFVSSAVCSHLNGGELLSITAGATTTRYYTLNLISLVGSLCPKYIPLCKLGAAGIRIEIQWVSSLQLAAACSAIANISSTTFTSVEFLANYVKLNQGAQKIVDDAKWWALYVSRAKYS